MRRSNRAASAAILALLLVNACTPRTAELVLLHFSVPSEQDERIRVLDLYPGVTATIVAPASVNANEKVELILYALPNGNSTAETIGRRLVDSAGWRYDIQHIGAQTRGLRARGLKQAIVVYLEADTKSWPEWRRVHGYERANARIVSMVEQLRMAIGNPPQLAVTLTGHSGGGSFAWGFIDGQDSLPDWLERIAFLDSNYSFETRHGDKIVAWLARNARNTLVVLAYDDREIMLDGKKVVSDSGGTWRASHRMINYLRGTHGLSEDTLGDFLRYHDSQVEILLHPNPANRILHTELVGEMNGYLHSLLVRRPGYGVDNSVLRPVRAYSQSIGATAVLPIAVPPSIPARAVSAITGSAFIASVAGLPREAREAAVRRELLAGNIPSFLRTLRTVEVAAIGTDGISHSISYDVMPDYLAIGSDEDFVRMPMNPYSAQAFCDAFGFVLPTRKMVDDIWAAATVHIDPRPLTQDRDSSRTFLEHNKVIDEQLAGYTRGALVAGIKKDVVLTDKLLEKPERVAIYGWHYATGQAIQPLYTGHVDWYVDYSHGVRAVRRVMRVDGIRVTFEKILSDPRLAYLLSDESKSTVSRYEKTAIH